ncbi:MAG: hypothetical protein GY866_32155, partial [Proteobacteria bacterium]|nr:hypothetical protein [Pseudomonadota bacterium]
GRFGAMLKFAGWDGIAIQGKADKPVWVDVRNDEVAIRDAKHLWGNDSWQAQETIWREVTGRSGSIQWTQVGTGGAGGQTTQKPAVLAIGQAGENLSRAGCLIHDAGHASGQGGFGGVWGSKNLKAISVIGTGDVKIADPAGLMKARLWVQKKYGADLNNPRASWWTLFGQVRKPQNVNWTRKSDSRLNACIGCPVGCKEIHGDGRGNQAICAHVDTYLYADRMRHGKDTMASRVATDLLQRYGINAYEPLRGIWYTYALYRMRKLGPGREIECDLPFNNDPNRMLMLDNSTENIYSENIAKLVAWHRYYTRFWKQSILYCDQRWPDFINTKVKGYDGLTPEGEPLFFNAVTGQKLTFLDGIEIGKKIWNLDNAIWTLQGRHRDMVHFADHIYERPYRGIGLRANYYLPGRNNGKWDYIRVNDRKLDRGKFDEFKTRFYQLSGWDTTSGWPTKKTLDSLDLPHVVKELESRGKLGKDNQDPIPLKTLQR